jgi:hypothetical protein
MWAGHPVSLRVAGAATFGLFLAGASRRRQAETDQKRHSAVQVTATNAINAAVVYRIPGDSMTYLPNDPATGYCGTATCYPPDSSFTAQFSADLPADHVPLPAGMSKDQSRPPLTTWVVP